MKKITTILGILALVFSLGLALNVSAAEKNKIDHSKLACFDGPSEDTIYGGTCTLSGKDANAWALLDNTDGDSDGDYSGVYMPKDKLDGKMLSKVKHLSFRYVRSATAGAPRISLPIDTNKDGTTEFYAFIGAYYCNDGAGLVDAIRDQSCTIYAGSENFANWNAMLSAHPDWQIADSYTFIIADEPGFWAVSDIQLGK